jgi:hypothetical protein
MLSEDMAPAAHRRLRQCTVHPCPTAEVAIEPVGDEWAWSHMAASTYVEMDPSALSI